MGPEEAGRRWTRPRASWLLRGLLLILAGVVLLRTAWMSDDSYITLRTIDNFVHGRGLVWNCGERVQTFTHPLWLFLLSVPYAVTHDAFHTVLALSLVVSLLAFFLLLHRARVPEEASLSAGLLLLCCRSFVDYSSSGLENPLTHLLLVVFALQYFADEDPPRRFLNLAVIAGLAVLNRMDSILLFAPALAFVVWHRRPGGWARSLLVGFLPFALWTVFSVFYYGIPYPNTALAKLNTGLTPGDLIPRGLAYLADSLRRDPPALPLMAAGLTGALVWGNGRARALGLGVGLYLLYVIWIGGDFMSGRFLSAPLLLAVVLLAHLPGEVPRRWRRRLLPVALLATFFAPSPSFFSGPRFGLSLDHGIGPRGLADERRYYFPQTGWFNGLPFSAQPAATLGEIGRVARQGRSPLMVEGAIGLRGFDAGPAVHVVDYYALADPLLARLPIVQNDELIDSLPPNSPERPVPRSWVIGHFLRAIPRGYLLTILTGKNVIEDPATARLYDQVHLVTAGPLWSGRRFAAIAQLNLEAASIRQRFRSPPGRAAIDWDELIAARPDVPGFYFMRAEALSGRGRTKEAEEDLRHAVALNPQFGAALSKLGSWAMDEGDPVAAETYWRAAVAADPDLSTANLGLGTILRARNQPQDALPFLRRAWQICQGQAPVLDELGLTYLDLGNPRAAATAFDDEMLVSSHPIDAVRHAAVAHQKAGDRRRARALAQRWLTLDPGNPDALSILDHS